MAEYDPTASIYPTAHDTAEDTPNSYEDSGLDADAEGEEDDDYDPSSFNFDPEAGDVQSTELMQADEQEPVPVPSETTAKAPKTIGGFIVEDEDDEDESELQEPEKEPEPVQSVVPSSIPQLNGADNAGVAEPAASQMQIQLPGVPIASEAQDTAAVLSAAQTDPQSALLNGASTSTPTPTPAFSAPATDIPAPDFVASAPSFIAAPAPASSMQSPAPPTLDQSQPQEPTLPAPVSIAPRATATPQPAPTSTTTPSQPPAANTSIVPTAASQRLPHDKVGQLEDRIKDDPKGDLEAWRGLIAHYREKGQLENARKVYTRFFEVFPTSASIWIEYAQMELEQDQLSAVEKIFNTSLIQLASVDMWTLYIDYLRRIHPLINDTDGTKRGILFAAFEMAFTHIGIDPDSGRLWREYVDFIKSYPGTIGGTGWQDAQKSDQLRKAYHQAIKLPHAEVGALFKEYNQFELGMNKATGRKYLQEQSPHYMTAKTARTQLERILLGLDRTSLPKLPPLYGCAGDLEDAAQMQKWRAWVAWEKEDPLVFREEEVGVYRQRIVYAYKQATMQMRFHPEMWYEAASWCFAEKTDEMIAKGEEFLDQGLEANPESVLLALVKAERVESSLEGGNSDEAAVRNGKALDVVFEGILQPLYALFRKTSEKIKAEVVRIQEYYDGLTPEEDEAAAMLEDADEKGRANDLPSNIAKPKTRAQRMQEQIDTYRSATSLHQENLKATISYLWIAKMRAFRRIQGQGQPNKEKKGLRGVFAEARPRGLLTSAVYIASAQMEWFCYKDPSASKIFDRGHKLFPLDEGFTVEYLRHLVQTHDQVNARAVFETTITKILGAPAEKFSEEAKKGKCRVLLEYMLHFEADYGDLEKVQRIERRMAEMYLAEPPVARFAARNSLPAFDAISVQLILSPTQMVPKTLASSLQPPSEQPLPLIASDGAALIPRSPPFEAGQIRLGPNGPYLASPKRALDDSDTETGPQRKHLRGSDSPLKGAAGRRVGNPNGNSNGSITTNAGGGSGGFVTKSYVPGAAPVPAAGPAPLPMEVAYLLSILPPAREYRATEFDARAMVELLGRINLPAKAR